MKDTLKQLAKVTTAIRSSGAKLLIQKPKSTFDRDASFDSDHPQIRALRRDLEISLLPELAQRVMTTKEKAGLEIVPQQGLLTNLRSHTVAESASNLSSILERLVEANLRRRYRALHAQNPANLPSNTVQAQDSMSDIQSTTTQAQNVGSKMILQVPRMFKGTSMFIFSKNSNTRALSAKS